MLFGGIDYCAAFYKYVDCYDLILISAFAGFYSSEIIKNVIHTTISGIFGSYYVSSL